MARTKTRTKRKNLRDRRRRKKVRLPKKIGFPNVQSYKLRYVTTASLIGTSGAIGFKVIRATSPYAPELSGGHEALGMDELKRYYNEYLVTGAKITCEFLPNANSTNPGVAVGVLLNDNSAFGATSYGTLKEQGRGKMRYILPNQDSKPTVLTSTYSCKGFWRIKDYGDCLGDKGAVMTSTPKDQAYFIIYAQSIDHLASNTVNVVITVDYNVRPFTPLELVQS